MTEHKEAPGTVGEILIVEDSPLQATLLKRILMLHGYAVTVARDGAEGLAMVRTRRPTLVISDIKMPHMDGYALCQAIKQDVALRDIPIILLTSFSDPEEVGHGLQVGAEGYLTKPCEAKDLLARVAQLLTHRKPREAGGAKTT